MSFTTTVVKNENGLSVLPFVVFIYMYTQHPVVIHFQILPMGVFL